MSSRKAINAGASTSQQKLPSFTRGRRNRPRSKRFAQDATAVAIAKQHPDLIASLVEEYEQTPFTQILLELPSASALKPSNDLRLCGAPHKRNYAESGVMRS